MVPEHEITRILHDDVVDPAHADRDETPEFRAAKARLQEDGHYRCWICGTTEMLQVHHFVAEFMFKEITDLAEAQAVAEAFDVYGYGRLLRHKPMTSVEDVRCMMVLCRTHHIGVDHQNGRSGTGIHESTFSTWLMQRLAKKGLNPVPQPGETLADVLKRLVAAGGEGDE